MAQWERRIRMNLKTTINNKNYDLVNGVTFSEEYNETLDSGSIIIVGVPKDNDLRPFDDVFIYDKESEFNGYKSRKKDYFEVHNQVIHPNILIDKKELNWIYEHGWTRGSLQFVYYKNNVKQSTLMKLRRYTNPVRYEIATVDGSTYASLTDDGSGHYVYNYTSTPLFAQRGYFEYFVFTYNADNIEMPTFYKHLLIDNFTEERLNPTSNLYKYKISLMSEIKKMERIQLPNISITQPRDISLRKSVAEYIHQFVEMYSPTIKVATSDDTFMYVSKYEVDDSIDEIFGNVYCPNFTLDNPSLRTLLNQLFLVKDRIPYVKDDVIYAMDITERKGVFSLNKTNSITASRTSENHCTGLKRSYKDALSGNNTARMVEYIGFRNSDNSLLTLGNMRVETKFPIYKINKIYLCYYKKAQVWTYNTNQPSYTGEDKVFLCKQDITKLVLQEEARNLISKDWNDFSHNRPNTIDEMAEYKLCTVGYTIGSNKIEGWGTSYDYPNGWWGVTTATKTYIENIFDILDEIYPYGIYDVGYLSKELGAGKYITINSQITYRLDNIVSPIEATKGALRLKSFFFMVDYEGFYNGTLNTSKDDENRDDIVTNDNPSSSLTLLEKDGLFQKEKANRFGNKAYSYYATYDDISELQELGSVDNSTDDDVIIYHREYAIYDNYVKASYFGCKDYVLKNYYTNVYAKHRPYDLLPYSQSIIRSENRKQYLMLSKNTLYYDEVNTDYNVNPPMNFNSFENYIGAFLSFVKPSLKPLSIDKFNNPDKLNYGYITHTKNGVTRKYSNDINIFASGYSLCMNISMWDNTSMGNYISDLEPTMNVSAPEDDLTGSIQSFYSVVDNRETGFTETMGFYFSHTPQEDFSDIVIDYYSGIADDLYSKILNIPLLTSTNESDIIGKEYKINKDNKEVIDMTFQIEPFTNDKNIIFSEWIMKLCDLYGTYNKFAQNVTVVDTHGYLKTFNSYCGTVYWEMASTPSNVQYHNPMVLFIIPIGDFSSLGVGAVVSFSYDWNVSLYDSLWEQHSPWDDVLVGLNVQTSTIVSITADEIKINAFIVKKIRHGWWGGTTDDGADYVLTLKKVSRLANIDFTGDTSNYYFCNIEYEYISQSDVFKVISLGKDMVSTFTTLQFKDTNDLIYSSTAIWDNSNHSVVDVNYGDVTPTEKTYLKNYFIRFVNQKISKTLVYDEYAEGEINFPNIRVDEIVRIVEETNQNVGFSETKTYLEFDISHYPQSTGLEIWYADREDDSVANGTLHFVLGINFSDDEILNGKVRIYASLLNKKDTRVFGKNNLVCGEIVNYKDNSDFNYGENQYYVVK